MYYDRVLVTGCCGDIGIALARILKEEKITKYVYGCDVNNEHTLEMFYDKCFTIPRADEVDYFDRLMDLVKREEIDLVIPSSEAELRMLAENNFYGEEEWFLAANIDSMRLGFDKYLTNKFLESKNLPFPWTLLAYGNLPLEYPCILKSREGCGSKRVFVLNEPDELNDIVVSDGDIFQEFLKDNDAEYTCCVFRGKCGVVRSIAFKRKLKGGLTGSGVVVNNLVINELLYELAEMLNLIGSINIQLRIKDGVPMIFEINPRFSSTVRFRNMLGFKDLLWSVQEKIGIGLDDYKVPKEGTKFLKIYEEIIL